ncbi:SAM-dependent methyltransferase [Desertifilum sp. FACHB-1129]|uniref:Modification methylase n=1 Tax=Desertifilum tharense IPPAS B-1220 TaxID=1781255 RepID=A0A1E5QQ10_9CYAN|nr:SAM-dependent methyltransferase [Desertifilum sp. FACHB-1129]MBD2321778.1 SAM-dependent methyltransferase [Desertifilum sp. FACHB-866]MBD2331905.1 SAM-dependent methyltransferase [Desertifilum sp. FACHB-868]MDA0212572.1 class I SAM-dependent methyltransferase [Cyanobacteria bacterium FC1]OEJ76738.1 modification methylase [Desertifilum tharense IPPAS B-1220]
MVTRLLKEKIEYGDFQTPIELAEKICCKLVDLGIEPDIIIEPTCGIGNFIKAAANTFQSANQVIGIDINYDYINKIKQERFFLQDTRITIHQADFFQFNWSSLVQEAQGHILIIGNLPWVTNSKQGKIQGDNLPLKTNFKKYSALEAITGKSNFDISEWMLIQIINHLQQYQASIAVLCKTSVARKLLSYIHSQKLYLDYCASYKIDAKRYFAANVDACLLFCTVKPNSQNYFCDVFNNLDEGEFYQIGYHASLLVKDIDKFNSVKDLYDPKPSKKWRSGIKHDCSDIMEFHKIQDGYINGLGEIIDLEETYIFPLIKGSDVAQGRIENSNRYVLVTQRLIGEPTDKLKDLAPKTWKYLEHHAPYLDNRKSKIYKTTPCFSIFGVGEYTFSPWKIAICGLYKKLSFRLVGTIENKPTIFDDTVYFLSFDNEEAANQAFTHLTSPLATDFYSSLIFWDEKRPIKTSILNCLNLSALAKRLSVNC